MNYHVTYTIEQTFEIEALNIKEAEARAKNRLKIWIQEPSARIKSIFVDGHPDLLRSQQKALEVSIDFDPSGA